MPLCLTACFHSSLPFSLQSWDHKQSGCFNTFLRGHVNISIRAFIFSFFPPSFVLVGTKSSFLHLVLFVLPLPIFLPHPSLPLYFSPLHQVCLLVFLLLLLLHLSLSVSLTISPCLDSLFVSLSLTAFLSASLPPSLVHWLHPLLTHNSTTNMMLQNPINLSTSLCDYVYVSLRTIAQC